MVYPSKEKSYANQYNRNYYATHKEQFKKHNQNQEQYRKNWKLQHPERVREQDRKSVMKWRKEHPEEAKEATRKWGKGHPEYVKLWHKQWRLKYPEKLKEMLKKMNHKRRGLGFDPFNEAFENSEAHHIDFECVVYVPRELHNSIRHNIWTGYNMNEINNKVLEWLIEHGFSRQTFISHADTIMVKGQKMNDKDKKKVNTKDEKIWVMQMQQRYGYDDLHTMYVPNPNFGNKRKRKPKDL